MSNQQDPAAASAPFDSTSDHVVVERLAQDEPSETSLAQDKPSESTEPRTFEIVVKRFGFEPSRIEVTEGERVRLIVKSADGVHGAEIKKFKVNKKVPRGG